MLNPTIVLNPVGLSASDIQPLLSTIPGFESGAGRLMPSHDVVVAYLGGAAVGVALYTEIKDPDTKLLTGQLSALAVRTNHRRAGIGGALLGAVEGLASEDGFPALQLHLAEDEDEPTRNFFSKHGYVPIEGSRRRGRHQKILAAAQI